MKLEDQVCALEYSKRLKELNVKQESLFCWTTDFDLEFLPTEIRNNNVCIAAFTVAELGELLPRSIWHKGKDKLLICEPANRLGYWLVGYSNEIWMEEITEADARAKLLINLIENNLWKPE